MIKKAVAVPLLGAALLTGLGSLPSSGATAVPTPPSISSIDNDAVIAPASAPTATSIKNLPRNYSVTRTTYSTAVTRWDSCSVIHWRINTTGAPKSAYNDAKGAIARIEKATGLHYVFDGFTRVVPDGDYGKNGDKTHQWPALTIAFVTAGTTKDLPSGAAGVGGWHAISVSKDQGSHWQPRIVAGFVQIDRARASKLKPGFGGGESLGELLMHELGHTVGLGHVGTVSDIMYPLITPKVAVWGSGDLMGLRAVGSDNGCLPGLPPIGGYVTYK